MITSGEIKRGIVLELGGTLYSVLDFQHIKIGRGSAQTRLKLRDIQAGHTIEQTFPAGEKFKRARLEERQMQYLYSEGNLHYFMDTENFEQITLDSEQLGDALNYLNEGLILAVSTYEDKPIGVELPTTVALKIADTGPAFRGDTSQSGTKPATLETGLAVQVPFFIETGDAICVDTRTGKYVEKEK